MKSLGDSLRGAQAAVERLARERREAKERFIAGGGTCFDCLDTGWTNWRVERHDRRRCCEHCAMGAVRLAEIRDEIEQLIIGESPLTPLALDLGGIRTANAEAVRAEIEAWMVGWPVTWRAVGPHIDDHPFLLLHGPTGSGKTTAAATVVNQLALKTLLAPNYVNAKAAIDTMRERGAGRDPGPYPGEGTWRLESPLLVDDLAVATHSEAAEAFHYSVVQGRYERKWPTVFTTNASLTANGGERSLISRIGGRSYWRIIERSLVVEMTGFNWRDPRQNGR